MERYNQINANYFSLLFDLFTYYGDQMTIKIIPSTIYGTCFSEFIVLSIQRSFLIFVINLQTEISFPGTKEK